MKKRVPLALLNLYLLSLSLMEVGEASSRLSQSSWPNHSFLLTPSPQCRYQTTLQSGPWPQASVLACARGLLWDEEEVLAYTGLSAPDPRASSSRYQVSSSGFEGKPGPFLSGIQGPGGVMNIQVTLLPLPQSLSCVWGKGAKPPWPEKPCPPSPWAAGQGERKRQLFGLL